MQGRFLVRDAGRERLFEICDDVTLVGTDTSATLRLRDNACAAQHCEVRRSQNGFKLVDLETASGTSVNGRAVNQCMLRDGDIVTVGAAQLEFRGDNPKPGAAAQPAAPLRRLPVDDSGEVRRFYRHDAPRRGPSMLLVVVSAIVLLGIGVLILKLGESASHKDKARRTFAEAEKLIREGTVRSTQEALKLLSNIAPDDFDARTLRETRANAEREHARLAWQDMNSQATGEHARIVAVLKNGPEDLEVLDQAVERMRRTCVGTKALADLEQRLDKLLLAGTGLQRTWQAVLDDSNRLVDAQDHRAALQVLNKAEANADLGRVMARRIAQRRETISEAWQKLLRNRSEEAARLLAAGDRPAAALLLRAIADSGMEPEASKARAQLAKPR
ncbi:MAG: FHA domain-containing protein [Planctomycetes bacterium]|nr:FHA domain-containing protein [Planctomycetota bacterium]